MKTKLQTIRGFRDYYPKDMAFQNWLYQKIKKVSRLYGFQEYDGPIVERLSLYAAKSGDELVKKQAFTFKDNKGKMLALRPEMTPTLARMVAQKEEELTFPLKWFSFGPRFRYEKPQKGRGREFYQWDIDILGTKSFLADAEVIVIAASFYKSLGLSPKEVRIKINDRKFMQEKLLSIGVVKENILNTYRVIDKINKLENDEFEDLLTKEGLSKDQITKLEIILKDKSAFTNSDWLNAIFETVRNAGFGDYIEFDPTIVRGLDYYTRTVFEGWDIKGNFRSIWGGGRYDNLTKDVGSKNTIPGVGFAMGDMVLERILKELGKYPKLKINKTKVLVTVFSDELLPKSVEITCQLRDKGIASEIYLTSEQKLDKQLKYADKKQIPYVLIIGPDEVKNKTYTLKDMEKNSQDSFPLEKIIKITSQ